MEIICSWTETNEATGNSEGRCRTANFRENVCFYVHN